MYVIIHKVDTNAYPEVLINMLIKPAQNMSHHSVIAI